jgi:hypothetical protein
MVVLHDFINLTILLRDYFEEIFNILERCLKT